MLRVTIPNGIPAGILHRSPVWDPKAGTPVTAVSRHSASVVCGYRDFSCIASDLSLGRPSCNAERTNR